jgi:hypothetical protein
VSASLSVGQRLPVELRAERALGADLDAGTLTLGVELSF